MQAEVAAPDDNMFTLRGPRDGRPNSVRRRVVMLLLESGRAMSVDEVIHGLRERWPEYDSPDHTVYMTLRKLAVESDSQIGRTGPRCYIHRSYAVTYSEALTDRQDEMKERQNRPVFIKGVQREHPAHDWLEESEPPVDEPPYYLYSQEVRNSPCCGDRVRYRKSRHSAIWICIECGGHVSDVKADPSYRPS